MGDLIFSPSVFEESIDAYSLKGFSFSADPVPGRYGTLPNWVLEALPECINQAELFIDKVIHDIDWSSYTLVGFGTMFQIVPSIALAYAIKKLPNAPKIIFGGANCEDEMGEAIHKAFPWIDFICRGEGEQVIVDVMRYLGGELTHLNHVEGLIWHDNDTRAHINTGRSSVKTSLDDLPHCTYDDWFEQFYAAKLAFSAEDIMLPIETSRGCWYGFKNHCTFCGLNGSSLAFRSKSPARVIEEVEDLRHYGVKSIHAVDNILDFRYFNTLLPELAKLKHGLSLFYEVKANLTREQLRLIKAAGINWVQPGIESLSTSVLKLMRKGVAAYQNVRLLKLGAELHVGITWNILYGFPYEDPEEYYQMADLIPLIVHLQPPVLGCNRVRLDRFSPLFFAGESLGVASRRPCPVYSLIFPLPDEDLHKLAYYFEYEYASPQSPLDYIAPLRQRVREWQDLMSTVSFTAVLRQDKLYLFDYRPLATTRKAVLKGLKRDIYLACDEGITLDKLHEKFADYTAELYQILQEFLEQRWVVRLDNRYLSLAVEMHDPLLQTTPEIILGAMCHTIYCERMASPKRRIESGLKVPDKNYEALSSELTRTVVDAYDTSTMKG